MKKSMKIGLGIATVSAMLLLTGCGAEKISDTALSYRNTDLNQDASTPKVEYLKNAAGSGVRLKRGFQDAPPMIPHDTEGMLPITRKNNACLGCHMPDVAKSMNATPIPKTHFIRFSHNSIIVRAMKTGVAE